MKINKIFACLLASAMLVACSDDDDSWNSGSATVSMGQEEITLKENAGLFNVPVQVEGTQDGPIQVIVEVAETGANPAKEDVNYLVTSKTIIIPADAQSGNIEIKTVDDKEINDTRTFTVSIVNVQGAQPGAVTTTTVGLIDNDAVLYEKLQGDWTMSNSNGDNWHVQILGFNEGEAGYEQVLYLVGIEGDERASLPLLYDYNEATQQGSLTIPFGELVAEGVNFGAPVGVCDVYTGTLVGNNIVLEGSITGGWNDTFDEITFEDKELDLWLAPTGTTSLNGYRWDAFSSIKLTR